MKNAFWFKLALTGCIIAAFAVIGVSEGLKARPAAAEPACAIRRNARTLIIDPGHGGADGGAVSVTGRCESGINLEISLKLRDIAGLYGVVPVMTRDTEDIDYPESATTIRAKKVADQRARVELITSIDNAVLLSIHQNNFTSPGPRGSQAFFAGTEGSEEFATLIQGLLQEHLSPSSRTATRIGSTIFLMNAVECPAVLIECGFLSNPAEAALLEDGGYQVKLAALIFGGYMQFIG